MAAQAARDNALAQAAQVRDDALADADQTWALAVSEAEVDRQLAEAAAAAAQANAVGGAKTAYQTALTQAEHARVLADLAAAAAEQGSEIQAGAAEANALAGAAEARTDALAAADVQEDQDLLQAGIARDQADVQASQTRVAAEQAAIGNWKAALDRAHMAGMHEWSQAVAAWEQAMSSARSTDVLAVAAEKAGAASAWAAEENTAWAQYIAAKAAAWADAVGSAVTVQVSANSSLLQSLVSQQLALAAADRAQAEAVADAFDQWAEAVMNADAAAVNAADQAAATAAAAVDSAWLSAVQSVAADATASMSELVSSALQSDTDLLTTAQTMIHEEADAAQEAAEGLIQADQAAEAEIDATSQADMTQAVAAFSGAVQQGTETAHTAAINTAAAGVAALAASWAASLSAATQQQQAAVAKATENWQDWASQGAGAVAGAAFARASAEAEALRASQVAETQARANYQVTAAQLQGTAAIDSAQENVTWTSAQPASTFSGYQPTEPASLLDQIWDTIAQSADGIAIAGSVIFVGLGIASAFCTAPLWLPGAMIVMGVTMFVSTFAVDSFSRYAEGQSMGQALAGGLATATGVEGVYAGLTNTDIITGQSLNLSGYGRALRFGSGALQMMSMAAPFMSRFFRQGNCFAAGTPLLTPEGHRAIEDFQAGDLLLTRDERNPSAPIVVGRVEEVFKRTAEILHVHVSGQVIRTTAEHPFWAYNRNWVPAGELRVGDLLLSHDGQWTPVEDLLETGVSETVFNLRVAEHHTYFVGCNEWGFDVWVHNALYPVDDAGRQQLAQRLANAGYTPTQPASKMRKADIEAIASAMTSDADAFWASVPKFKKVVLGPGGEVMRHYPK